jgi:hypothetical protein
MRFFAVLALLAAADPEPLVEVSGSVVNTNGHSVPGVGIYAVDAKGALVEGWARSDNDGLFRLRVPERVHDFAVMSPMWLLASFQRVDDRHIRITVRPAFRDDPRQIVQQAQGWLPALARPRGAHGSATASVTYGPSVGMVEGDVADETGMRLPGVRVLAVVGQPGSLVNVTETDGQGRFTLVTAAGHNRLVLYSPGLKPASARHTLDGRLEITMTIDADLERLTVRNGRILRFHMSSVWPEILPPPEVAMELRWTYGIDVNRNFCPGDLKTTGVGWNPRNSIATVGITCTNPVKCPATAWQRQCQIPKYWWLRILQSEPPGNPAHIRGRWWEHIILEMQRAEAAAPAPGSR